MPDDDDALLGLLRPLAGRAVGFVPGSGGLDDAVAALCFSALCDRLGIAGLPDAASGPEDVTVYGSLHAACGGAGGRGIVLPTTVDRAEAIEPAFHGDLTVCLVDPVSARMAELQGLPAERRPLCRPMARHLDPAAIGVAAHVGEGTLRIGLAAAPPGPGDGVAIALSGADGRWRSTDRCEAAVRGVLGLMNRYAEIVTDSVGLAALAATIGRAVVLRAAPGSRDAEAFRLWLAPTLPGARIDAVDGAPADLEGTGLVDDVAQLRRLAVAARRDAQTARQDREALGHEAARLRERLDAGEAAALISAERGPAGVRLVAASLFNRRLSDLGRSEAEAAALRGRAEAAERGIAERDARLVAAEARASSLEEAARRRDEATERRRDEAAERERDVVAALEAALASRTAQALALQTALDQALLRERLADDRAARIRALADERAAAADRAQGRLGDQIAGLTSSFSWRLTRPLRAITRPLRPNRGGPDASRA